MRSMGARWQASVPKGFTAARLALLAAPMFVGLASGALAQSAGTEASSPAAMAAQTGGASGERPAGEPGSLRAHGGPVKALALAPDGQALVSGSFDYSFIVWDLGSDPVTMAVRFDEVEGAINALALPPGDQPLVVAGGDGAKLLVYDRAARAMRARLPGHTAKINGIDVSPDGGRAVSASWDRTARIWLLGASPAAGPVLEGHRAQVNAAVFSADGLSVFTAAADGEIRRFDAATGELVRTVHRHGWGINTLLRLDESGRIVFGALDGTVAVFDPEAGDPPSMLEKREAPILALALSPDGGLLASAGADGAIKLFNSSDVSLLETFQNPYGPIWALAFSGDGKSVYYGGLDDVIHRWQIAPRLSFEPLESPLPRRFQVSGKPDDPVAWGRVQFARKCSVCHTLKPDGRNRAGPTLFGIFGRPIASLDGYAYSDALKSLDIVWTPETVEQLFELGPDHVTPGSKMPLQKMSDPAARKALIAFLEVATEPGGEGVADGYATSDKTTTKSKGENPK